MKKISTVAKTPLAETSKYRSFKQKVYARRVKQDDINVTLVESIDILSRQYAELLKVVNMQNSVINKLQQNIGEMNAYINNILLPYLKEKLETERKEDERQT